MFAVMLMFSQGMMFLISPQGIKRAGTIDCGQRLAGPGGRIVNGRVSQRGSWPWQIAIYKKGKVFHFHCGGALISRRWVLTAAHCFYGGKDLMNNTDLYQIKAGDFNLTVKETFQQDISPKKIFVHPRFQPIGEPYFDGDIALVKLSTEVELGVFVRTVCLPEKREGDLAVPNSRGIVAGWGGTRPLKHYERFSHGKELSNILRHTSLKIQSDHLCKNKSSLQFNSKTAFCAGDRNGDRDSCFGDSGGGFVREKKNLKWVVVGIVSWGWGCAQKDKYGYYTRIHPFLDWIRETMETEDFECSHNTTDGQCCSIPFTYNGVNYHSCTTANHSRPWCSLDSTYKGKWGNCVECSLKTTVGQCCSIPFTYNGVTHHACTTANHNRQWCSLDSTYQGNWGNCVVQCLQKTTGGLCCSIPFTYKGVKYSSCTTAYHYRLWCSLDSTYSGNWGNCA